MQITQWYAHGVNFENKLKSFDRESATTWYTRTTI